MIINDATRLFIETHIHDDIRQLALKKIPAGVDKLLALSQIEARQILSKKVPSWAENQNLIFPKHLSIEQCSSELTAKYKTTIVEKIISAKETHCDAPLQPDTDGLHSTFIDLTGGLGIDSYFLSENFQNAYYVENQKHLCELAENNFYVLGRKINVINSDAESFLEKYSCNSCDSWSKKQELHSCNSCDSWCLIFVDPARRDAFNRKMVSLRDCSPDVVELQQKMLEVAEHVLIKASPMLDISLICNELKNIKEIHVVSVKNECKEILIMLERGFSGRIKIVCVNLRQDEQNRQDEFCCFDDDEKNAVPVFADTIKKYLYEPNSSLMKAGVFKLVSQYYKIDKLHINSHLYTSDNPISDFPGRVFEIVGFAPFNKKVRKDLLQDVNEASVATRNFPMSANDLRKNLGLRENDENFVFGTTLTGEKRIVILCKRI
ncbi:MAG: SAM-dependent methyltransferase [Bacteroidia bacterium]|nr:SAM-dependent methyltransferase [Bacteroidia bacterium]